ncbi:MAG: tyrosine-type recombinase/integrase [Caldilineales bacterium]|nr:tyrosine-type recombinase/integrase [Caldilineales bacterium]
MHHRKKRLANGIAHRGQALQQRRKVASHPKINLFPGNGQSHSPPSNPTHITCQDAYDRFILSREAAGCSPKTIGYYGQRVKPVLDALAIEGVTRLGDIDAHAIRKHLLSEQKRGLSTHTQAGTWRALRAFFTFCLDEGLVDSSPMINVQKPRLPKEVLPPFSTEDLDHLLRSCLHERDGAIIRFLLDTGVRASELAALNVADVDLNAKTVHVRCGKGGKGRITYIGDDTLLALNAYLATRSGLEPHHPLWVNLQTGKRLTDSGLRQLLERLGRKANVENCHPHTFRRTFALWSLRNGMNVFVLQRLMGHADLTVLRQYLALVQDDLATAHHRFGPVDNRP